MKIRAPVLPQFLYRYRSIEQSNEDKLDWVLQSIEHRSLHLSDFGSMNDPMEGFFSSGIKIRNKKYQDAIDAIKYGKLQWKFCCFSEYKNMDLMWTHYAFQSKGVCIEYKMNDLFEYTEDAEFLVKLSYSDEIFPVKNVFGVDYEDLAIDILSQKKASWSYEREWRLFSRLGIVRSSKQCISAVYLGAYADSRSENILRKKCLECGIKIYKFNIRKYNYKIIDLN